MRRCLRKDQNLRIHAIADARIEIDDIQTEPDGGRDAGPDLNRRELRSKPGRERLAWVSALAFVTVIAVGASVIAFRPAPAAPEMRVEITTPATTDPVSLAIFAGWPDDCFCSHGQQSVPAVAPFPGHRFGAVIRGD